MRALVTGATGFVGAAVARALLAQDWTVRALVRPSAGRRNIDGLDLDVVEGDLTDPSSLSRAVAGCEAVFHVAADYRLWVPDPERIYGTNVEGSANLVRIAAEAGASRIVYTSSVATLGLNKDASPAANLADEDTPVSLTDMIGHYKRSKYLAEDAVRKLVIEDGAPVVIVNPSTPLGPRDVKPTPTGLLVVEAASGRMPAYVDTGLNFVHVEDCARGHLLAYHTGRVGERYILGGHNLSLHDLLVDIAAIVGRKPPRLRLPNAAVMPIALVAEFWARVSGTTPRVTVDGVRLARKKMYFSIEKARRELGYEARPVHEALIDAIAWFRAEGYLD
jgi:dihydroflavonol-4-reductase